MPFHPHYLVDAWAGYGYNPETRLPHWLLTLSSRGRDYKKIFYITHEPGPYTLYDLDIYSHNNVPYIHLDSQALWGTHHPRLINLFVAQLKQLSDLQRQGWLTTLVRLMQERRPIPRQQLEWHPLAPEEPVEPAGRVDLARRVMKEAFVGGYERIRQTAQRARFGYPPGAPVGGGNPGQQQEQPGAPPSAREGGVDPAPQQNQLHEMRVIWPAPGQRANQTRQEQQGHHSCCVITGPSSAISTLTTIVRAHRVIGGYVLFWWCALLWLRVSGPTV